MRKVPILLLLLLFLTGCNLIPTTQPEGLAAFNSIETTISPNKRYVFIGETVYGTFATGDEVTLYSKSKPVDTVKILDVDTFTLLQADEDKAVHLGLVVPSPAGEKLEKSYMKVDRVIKTKESVTSSTDPVSPPNDSIWQGLQKVPPTNPLEVEAEKDEAVEETAKETKTDKVKAPDSKLGADTPPVAANSTPEAEATPTPSVQTTAPVPPPPATWVDDSSSAKDLKAEAYWGEKYPTTYAGVRPENPSVGTQWKDELGSRWIYDSYFGWIPLGEGGSA